MPPRRNKITPTPLPSAPLPPPPHQQPRTLQPQVDSQGPRRSSRLAASSCKSTNDHENNSGNTPSKDHPQNMTKQKEGASKQSADESATFDMQSLVEMEMNFKRDVKRRKLQVEESIIASEDGSSQLLRDILERQSHPFRPDSNTQRRLEGLQTRTDHGVTHPVPEPSDTSDQVDTKQPPPVNSNVLPLPWRGRLGYACLNTYLRTAKPSVFSSRTCRIASILEHRHPLADPSQPEHPTKNRPDKTKAADVALGQKYVEGIGLANARDIIKMLRWNDKFGIKFMRLSSDMFPFASHVEYGYKLAPFASDILADAGKVAAELDHRLTTHPGQFTQLGSPRKDVVTNAIRDLEYHDEMLSLLKLPPQQDRDAVMILHMGGTFPEAGGKPATIDRFRETYQTLSDSIRRRLVLENDDVSWSVHDLLPVCEELNIPLVLDYHHHNIVFDPTQCREGTWDISQPALSARISRTWTRKGIRQKMHYSEPCAGALTPRDRRKHSARVATLPPCPPDMDLMIEAKDKEQAVFDLMRTFRLPGYEKIGDVVAYEREDQDRPGHVQALVKKSKKPAPKSKRVSFKRSVEDSKRKVDVVEGEDDDDEEEEAGKIKVSPEEFGMGGPQGRVYWPAGFEEWLSPKKKERNNKTSGDIDD